MEAKAFAETIDEFCVIRPSTPSSCSDIKLFLPLHSRGFHFVGRQLIEAGQPPVPAGSVVSLRLGDYEVASVLEGMEGSLALSFLLRQVWKASTAFEV